MTLRILQFGLTGALARELLAARGEDVDIRAVARSEVDLADTAAVERIISESADIDLVVNVAAYTAVDKAESEPDLAYAVNANAPRAMARACGRRGIPLVHLSTEMVFSGEKDGGYVESDAPAPLMIYGASKLVGEELALAAWNRVLVIRVSWLFSAYGHNFLQTMLRMAKTQPMLKVVADQRARPTASADVAAFILGHAHRLAAAPAGAAEWGVLHFTNEGVASRYDMAREIFAHPAIAERPELIPVPACEFPLPARRAANAVLDSERLGPIWGMNPRRWNEALAEVIDRSARAIS